MSFSSKISGMQAENAAKRAQLDQYYASEKGKQSQLGELERRVERAKERVFCKPTNRQDWIVNGYDRDGTYERPRIAVRSEDLDWVDFKDVYVLPEQPGSKDYAYVPSSDTYKEAPEDLSNNSQFREALRVLKIDSLEMDFKNISKEYKKLVLKHHPDKGGDSEQFRKIQKDYEEIRKLLTEEEEKEFYFTSEITMEDKYVEAKDYAERKFFGIAHALSFEEVEKILPCIEQFLGQLSSIAETLGGEEKWLKIYFSRLLQKLSGIMTFYQVSSQILLMKPPSNSLPTKEKAEILTGQLRDLSERECRVLVQPWNECTAVYVKYINMLILDKKVAIYRNWAEVVISKGEAHKLARIRKKILRMPRKLQNQTTKMSKAILKNEKEFRASIDEFNTKVPVEKTEKKVAGQSVVAWQGVESKKAPEAEASKEEPKKEVEKPFISRIQREGKLLLDNVNKNSMFFHVMRIEAPLLPERNLQSNVDVRPLLPLVEG